MKLAVVAQRYGADINGGAELHARYIAELLARRHDVEVFTTCARDYVTWRNELAAGAESVNGIRVSRYPVVRERSPAVFGRLSQIVFEQTHSVGDEIAWLDSEGPTSPALVTAVERRADEFDFFLFFSYRYYHAWHGARRVISKAILVPTAERDPAIAVSIFRPVFNGVRGLMYNSFEERALINAISGNAAVPGTVVGIGSEIPATTDPARFRKTFGITGPFVIYVGRIDENKGCKELFDFFIHHLTGGRTDLSLVLVGNAILPVPDHPRIRHLGFLSDRDKFDAVAASAALVMPSYFESLSMVALEAWGLGRPVLANARCDVLLGQCLRSNAGLFYENAAEFSAALEVLSTRPRVNAALGANGAHYYAEHYAWPVIERKYADMMDRLKADARAGVRQAPLPPIPGFFARRRRDVPPARAVLDAVPAGPVLDARARPPKAARQRTA